MAPACCACWQDFNDCQGSGPFYLSTYVGMTQDPGTNVNPCYPFMSPTGPRATDPELYFTHINWAAVQPSLEGTITNPSVISVGGIVDLTLTAATGPIIRKQNAFPSFSGGFFGSTPLAFFSSETGETVRMEMDPPVCGLGFGIQPNNETARDDLIIHVWTTDGVTTYDEGENSIGDFLVDVPGTECEASIIAIFARTAGRKIIKIELRFDGSDAAGDPVPFAIDDVGICP